MITPKLICAYIGGNCESTLQLSLNSVLPEADKVVFIYDTNSLDNTRKILAEYELKYPDKIIVIERRYEQELLGANGRARSAYLKYCLDNFENDYVIVLDPDEVLDDVVKLRKKAEQLANNPYIKEKYQTLHPQMKHFIKDLGHEDALYPKGASGSKDKHFCLGRFFRLKKGLAYPESEHPVIGVPDLDVRYRNDDEMFRYIYIEWFNEPCIWHFGYAKGMFDIRKKYKNHLKKSKMHTPEFLNSWYKSHLFGTYPVKTVYPVELPKQIKDYFELGDMEDEFYFKDRQALEVKHFIDAIYWRNEYKLTDKKVLSVGCAGGQRLYTLREIGVDCYGCDVSEFIIDKTKRHSVIGKYVFVDDITDWKDTRKWDTVICYDVMEHISEDKVDEALKNLYNIADRVIFAITTTENGNIDEDPTHVTKKSGNWWREKLKEHKFILKSPDEAFLNKEFTIIAEKEGTDDIKGWSVFFE